MPSLSVPAWLQASQHYNDMEQLFKSAMPAEEAAEEIYAGLVKGQVGRGPAGQRPACRAQHCHSAACWLTL